MPKTDTRALRDAAARHGVAPSSVKQPISDVIIRKLCAAVEESMRLRKLTNAALVAEAVESGLVDYQLVSEMCDRLDPRWCWRSDEDEQWPASDAASEEEGGC